MAVKAVVKISGPGKLGRGTRASEGETVVIHKDAGGNEKKETISQSGHVEKDAEET